MIRQLILATRATFVVLAVSSLFVAGSHAIENPDNPYNEVDLGPPIGTSIPHDLTDVNGKGGFEELRGDNGMALFFVRSLDWCPFCKNQAKGVSKRVEEFESRGLSVVFVSYDSADKQARFVAQNEFKPSVLSDTDIEIINAFELRNKDYKEGSRVYGIPYPAVFIINNKGEVAGKIYEKDYIENKGSYRNRPAVDVILQEVDTKLGS